jgi:hypothetical protein
MKKRIHLAMSEKGMTDEEGVIIGYLAFLDFASSVNKQSPSKVMFKLDMQERVWVW